MPIEVPREESELAEELPLLDIIQQIAGFERWAGYLMARDTHNYIRGPHHWGRPLKSDVERSRRKFEEARRVLLESFLELCDLSMVSITASHGRISAERTTIEPTGMRHLRISLNDGTIFEPSSRTRLFNVRGRLVMTERVAPQAEDNH